MSETMPFPPISELNANDGGASAPETTNVRRTPTVYFIDDSATMREVIKIAFRRENYNVITCADASSALAQFELNRPDIVITDVIMPDQDGYSVCSHIKQHPDFGNTPVVLMSGVVNKSVADKAVSVHADELVRKPFQPQELINRVKALLDPKPASAAQPGPDHRSAPNALSNLFAPQPPQSRPAYPAPVSAPVPPAQAPQSPAGSWSQALADAFTPRQPASNAPAGYPAAPSGPQAVNPASPSFAQNAARPPATPADVQKLRLEIARLDLLVKKLQTELQIERQYNQALESQIRAITESA